MGTGDTLGQAGHTGSLPRLLGVGDLKDVYWYVDRFEVEVPRAAPGLTSFSPGGWGKG